MVASTSTGLLDTQLERYVAVGVPRLVGMDDRTFRSLAEPLINANATQVTEDVDLTIGYVPSLLVMGIDLITAEEMMPLVSVKEKPGYVDMNPTTPATFVNIKETSVPDAPFYLVDGFSCGDDLRDMAPSDAMKTLTTNRRSPITINEALGAAVLYPELIENKHYFSILGSRSSAHGATKCVPAIWISRGAPRLGWCWEGNPHSWLGTASCSGRSVQKVDERL